MEETSRTFAYFASLAWLQKERKLTILCFPCKYLFSSVNFLTVCLISAMLFDKKLEASKIIILCTFLPKHLDRGKKPTLLMPLLKRVYGGSMFITKSERICAEGRHYKCPNY